MSNRRTIYANSTEHIFKDLISDKIDIDLNESVESFDIDTYFCKETGKLRIDFISITLKKDCDLAKRLENL